MARTSPRRVTRLDREEASRSAASLDVGPVVRGIAVVAAVGLLAYVVAAVAPSDGALGGPLQEDVGGGTFTSIRKTGGDEVSLVVSVPWNAGSSSVVLEGLSPIDAEGVEIKRSGIAPPGGAALQSQRGFPPEGVTLLPLSGFTAAPGTGELDGFQIVVGLVGEGTVSGFVLRYRAGDASYVALLPKGAMLCASACEGREDAEDAQRADIAGLSPFVEAPDR